MKHTLIVAATLLFTAAALAGPPASAPAPASTPPSAPAWPPPMPAPGAEQKALERLVGTIVFDGMITPPAPAPSSATKITWTCKKVAADMWIACDTESTPADPKFPKFRSHVVIGYDMFAKEYRSFAATLQGVSLASRGALTAGKLVLLSDEVQAPAHKIKSRETVDFSDPKKIHILEERSADGGAWVSFGDFTTK